MWQEISKNLVWKLENFFTESSFERLEKLALNKSEYSKKSNNDGFVMTDSEYKYYLSNLSINQETVILSELELNLNNLFKRLRLPIFPKAPLKTSQAMIKCFTNKSNYALHAESHDIFGAWAYIVYLTDELQSPIEFVTKNTAQNLKSIKEKKDWEFMETHLQNHLQPTYYVDHDISIYPQKNIALAFRCGTAHRVPTYDCDRIGRFCLTGFPFAKIN